MTFWTNQKSDPKRAFKFKVTIGSTKATSLRDNISWMATQADKPKFTVSNTQHRYLNHTFNYPGRVEWDPVNITLVDPADPDAAADTMRLLKVMGYNVPNSHTEPMGIISKDKAVSAIGSITIQQLGKSTEKKDVLETWTLNNAWIEAATFSQLSYESEDLSTIELTIRYDWASFNGTNATDSFFTKGTGGTPTS